jgi:hypothetical protein
LIDDTRVVVVDVSIPTFFSSRNNTSATSGIEGESGNFALIVHVRFPSILRPVEDV